jgi:levanase/fructan beta-fructosidase
MRRKRIALMAMMMTAFCAVMMAQKPMLLSDNHAMMRVESASRYLLLPVEEKAEIANLRVLNQNSEVIQSLNARLSVDKVDYYVPLEIKGAALLDIVFHGDRRSAGAVKDYACWREMKYDNTFDTANRERFRPAYHHTPVWGWMNDPNGMFYQDGVWHLCYQWNPYGSQWENMTWGHSISKDLIHWEALPAAIVPDGLGTIFSGSCVVDKENTAGFGKNAIIAYYTSAAESQTQSMAYSTDGGRTFKKYDKNPVITSNIPDFRDPHLFWHEPTGKWIMVLAAGQEMQIYSSANLKNWTLESSFGHGYGNHDGVWECPDLMKLPVRGTGKEKWMLICNINPGGPFGGSATQYFVGDFDGHRFTCESKPEVTKWMDYGKDHYATVSFDNAPDGRHVAIAWMSNWQYANQVPTKQFRSANSIPRDLDLFIDGDETYCGVTPSKEMLTVRGKSIKKPTETCELVIDLKGSARWQLSNTRGERVIMEYDAVKKTFTMNREESGDLSFSEAFPVTTCAPTHGTVRQIRIYIDKCSLEAFDGEGKFAMTNLVFPSEPYNTVKVLSGKAKTTIYQVNP